MINLALFKMPETNIQFFDSGVEVGTPTHQLVQRFGSWKRVPETKSVYWCGDDQIQFTLLMQEGEPYEIAVYEFDSLAEFKHQREAGGWPGNAIYHKVNGAATGHVLIKILDGR